MQIKIVKKRYGLEKTIKLMVNVRHIRAERDTGADMNVMDEASVKSITPQIEL